MASRERGRFLLVVLVMLALHFYLRPRLWDARAAPDFLLLALLFYATRARPGAAALAGFLVGITMDSLVPARFGAAALATTVVGYLAAWGRVVFFADNLLVHAGFIWVGLWLRDAIVLTASGTGGRVLATHLLIWSPIQGLTTAVAGLLLMVMFRRWLSLRWEG